MRRAMLDAGSAISPRRDEVAEHAVRRMEHRDHRAPERIILGQVTPEETLLGTPTVSGEDGDDDDVCVERTHRLHTNQLEAQCAIREQLDGTKSGIRRDTKVTERAGDAIGLSGNALPFHPLELDLGAACPGRRAMKNEIGEAETFALQLRLGDDRPTGVLARRRRRKHAGSIGAGESDRPTIGFASATRLKNAPGNAFAQ